MDYPPGTYFIELQGNDPFLAKQNGEPLENPTFVADGDSSAELTLVIRVPSDPNFGFGPKAFEWKEGGTPVPQPGDIQSCLHGGTLTFTVFPPPALLFDAKSFHFDLFFTNGRQIENLAAHGLRPLDPTIIEKPEEPPAV
jgi:hypothetical protein